MLTAVLNDVSGINGECGGCRVILRATEIRQYCWRGSRSDGGKTWKTLIVKGSHSRLSLSTVLTALIDSWLLWIETAGDDALGRSWRRAAVKLVTTAGASRPHEDVVFETAEQIGVPRPRGSALLNSSAAGGLRPRSATCSGNAFSIRIANGSRNQLLPAPCAPCQCKQYTCCRCFCWTDRRVRCSSRRDAVEYAAGAGLLIRGLAALCEPMGLHAGARETFK